MISIKILPNPILIIDIFCGIVFLNFFPVFYILVFVLSLIIFCNSGANVAHTCVSSFHT
nr:MAG TPA: hypothetical protein [Bacteriophage sp.]